MRKVYLCVSALLMLLTQFTYAQRTIAGKVVSSADHTPLSGVTVHVKGTRVTTVTGNDGSFSLTTTVPNPMLEVSSIGFVSKSMSAISGSTIALDLDARSLSEIVVTGVGVATSKRKLGISVESISAEKLPQVPNASVDQALVGKVPGALIQSIDGTPGARTQIILRGINTIQGGTKPLILLDGIQVNSDLNQLDLNSIERIEIVQGAASATLYGAQGANGVIQLFSKKGKKGQVNITASTSFSIDKYLNVGNLHKARMHSYKTDASGNVVTGGGAIVALDDYGIYQGVTYQNGAGAFPTAQLNPANIYNKTYDKNLKYYDHFGQVFGTAHSRNHNLNISGGGEKVDYSFGFANNHQESAIRNNGYNDRSNFTTNIGAEIFKGFNLRSTTQLVYTKNTLNPNFQAGRNSIFDMLNAAPFYDLTKRLPDGTLPYYLGADNGIHSVNGNNTNFYFDYVEGKETTIDVIQNLQANYTVNRFLDLEAKYGINYTRDDANWIWKDQSQNVNVQYDGWASQYNGTDANGEIDNFNSKNTLQNFLASAFIKTDFQKDFHSQLPIITSTQLSYDYRKNVFNNYITYGQHLQPYPIYNLNQTASQHIVTDFTRPFVTFGFLVNQKVDVGEFGGFSVGVRSDYSSAFGRGSKPATFPRGDAYLRLSSFNFWKNSLSNTIREMKIRTAYGKAGIQPGAFDRYR
ncbi:MAG: TonB-dependent receptor plug domain-containing protein, partial [Bacteroidota bacterium]|nr:TonB-dependent receptor plug domain-containing protein [Bacteroidota bacterium]